MSFDKNFTIQVMYPTAQAAYEIMNGPAQISLPEGYSLVGAIVADSNASQLTEQNTIQNFALESSDPMALGNAIEQIRIANVVIAESRIFGLVAINQDAGSAIIAIRGTKTLWEWIADFSALLTPFTCVPDSGNVHLGISLIHEKIRASILDLLNAHCQSVKKLFITGHSLGAALAILCAADVAANSSLKTKPELNTFAGPRVGDSEFAENFDDKIKVCNRIVNFLDVVPHLPLPPLFQHVGKEIPVNGGFRPWDITYAHHLTTYLAGLLKLEDLSLRRKLRKAAGAR